MDIFIKCEKTGREWSQGSEGSLESEGTLVNEGSLENMESWEAWGVSGAQRAFLAKGTWRATFGSLGSLGSESSLGSNGTMLIYESMEPGN